jgi:hypothetical protein
MPEEPPTDDLFDLFDTRPRKQRNSWEQIQATLEAGCLAGPENAAQRVGLARVLRLRLEDGTGSVTRRMGLARCVMANGSPEDAARAKVILVLLEAGKKGGRRRSQGGGTGKKAGGAEGPNPT